ncbi:MAG: ABC-ATPase domain-containing protein [Clostridia bacterium]|nr:ABC-ATPase domain-containing protein [Clostridia bacterium]
MKRLKCKLLSMDSTTTTYKAIYEGSMLVRDLSHPSLEPYMDYNATYYYEDMGFEITTTHKLAQDRPTVVISIPCAKIGLDLPEKTVQSAVADFCLRTFREHIDELNADLYNRSRPDNESGKYYFCTPGGEVLRRNTAFFALCPPKDYENGPGFTVTLLPEGVAGPPQWCLCFRVQVQLPRRNLRKAVQMMCRDLPDAVERFVEHLDRKELEQTVQLAQKQAAIRRWLKDSNYCAFVANGSILPRAKEGDKPMAGAVPFQSTAEDEIEICGVKGMGFKRGVTVITGGGYSGKSTLLDALSAGIYDHALGDGRELCIADSTAVTVSAEDGRSVKHVNISPFVRWLPGGDTHDFSTAHASGSTSQATNIMEAVESGAKLLLIDEDRSATNFMIRDGMMKELIEKEPITPFTDRVRELCRHSGVSTVLVIGGSGEYLSVADKIYKMEDYRIHDVTQKAKRICASHGIVFEPPIQADWLQCRCLYADGFSSFPEGSGTERLSVSDMGMISIGDERIDVRGLHDIISFRQLETLGFMLRHLEITNKDRKIEIHKKIDDLYARIEEEGLDFLYSSFFTTCGRFLDLPRKQELLAVIYRMRNIHIAKKRKE